MKKWEYSVKYNRTPTWWDNEGEWFQLSKWLDETFGRGEWDYNNQYFLFQKESHKNWFILRWA